MSKLHEEQAPKRILALPDLEQAKSAVLNSLSSASGQRTYTHAIDEFVGWYCSEPRLAFNRTVVLRYRIHLEQRAYAPATINLRLAAGAECRRGGRCRPSSSRTRGGSSAREGRSATGRARRKLADGRTGPTAAPNTKARSPSRGAQSRHARPSDWLRTAAGRTPRAHARRGPAARRALGDRGRERKSRSRSVRSRFLHG